MQINRCTTGLLATSAESLLEVDDMVIPSSKNEILSSADNDVREIQEQFSDGLVTEGERYNKVRRYLDKNQRANRLKP